MADPTLTYWSNDPERCNNLEFETLSVGNREATLCNEEPADESVPQNIRLVSSTQNEGGSKISNVIPASDLLRLLHSMLVKMFR